MRKKRQKYRKTAKNVKKPQQNRQKYPKIIENVKKLRKKPSKISKNHQIC